MKIKKKGKRSATMEDAAIEDEINETEPRPRRRFRVAVREKEPKLSLDTRKSIAAILTIGVAVLLVLAQLGKAGPVGQIAYSGLDNLFGWGYYLLPLMSVVVALVFLIGQQQQFLSTTFIGALFVILFGLGIIDIIFPTNGGVIGNIIGLLKTPFGYTGGLVLMGVFVVISLLVTLNAKIRIVTNEMDDEYEGDVNDDKDDKLIVSTPEGKKELKDVEDETSSVNKKEKIKTTVATDDFEFKVKDRKKAIVDAKNYAAPPLSLLKSAIEKPTPGDLRSNANIIKRTLESFGIPVEMGEISIGPKVTRYTLKPAEGIKLTRITALNQDLSLALAAHPIRIEAPIPGKSLVGIEVPNKAAAIVRLGNLLGYPEFSSSGPLSIILGRDVTGEPITTNIEKMPHLLIAGATGSGKSVAIHTMITSMLYKNSPETLRFILIDPKRVELSVYNGIPHLIAPVIVEGKKAIGVFRWAIQEMERRYEVLLAAHVRDIKGYNKNRKGNTPPLPYLVIIVDELADLMAAYGREVETSIVRLAQMARATGIHLVLATQRPSVEVITGLIKANIPSRVALQVASQVDSRTILDSAGAEKLLGGGDMLFVSPDFSKPKRIQGAYITEEEVKKVSEFIGENNQESESAISAIDQAMRQSGVPVINNVPNFDQFVVSDDDGDEMYEEALQVVTETQKASASFLQRRLKVGYARAARLLDIMEAKGVIGPGDGAKPREVFLNKPSDQDFDKRDFE